MAKVAKVAKVEPISGFHTDYVYDGEKRRLWYVFTATSQRFDRRSRALDFKASLKPRRQAAVATAVAAAAAAARSNAAIAHRAPSRGTSSTIDTFGRDIGARVDFGLQKRPTFQGVHGYADRVADQVDEVVDEVVRELREHLDGGVALTPKIPVQCWDRTSYPEAPPVGIYPEAPRAGGDGPPCLQDVLHCALTISMPSNPKTKIELCGRIYPNIVGRAAVNTARLMCSAQSRSGFISYTICDVEARGAAHFSALIPERHVNVSGTCFMHIVPDLGDDVTRELIAGFMLSEPDFNRRLYPNFDMQQWMDHLRSSSTFACMARDDDGLIMGVACGYFLKNLDGSPFMYLDFIMSQRQRGVGSVLMKYVHELALEVSRGFHQGMSVRHPTGVFIMCISSPHARKFWTRASYVRCKIADYIFLQLALHGMCDCSCTPRFTCLHDGLTPDGFMGFA